jgi:hypothetical protein
MHTYAKLFSDILHSTIWQQPNHIKVVWVTMLAMADKEGQVGASCPGLAKAAGVSLADCREALSYLLSPDSESRTKEYGGRRIAEMSGGWLILNYKKYRDIKDAESVRESVRARVRKYRERKESCNADVTQCNACNACNADVTHVTQCNAKKQNVTTSDQINSDHLRSDQQNLESSVCGSSGVNVSTNAVKTNTTVDLKKQVDLVVKKKSKEILAVFDCYREKHPRSHPKPKSTSKEWRAIKARLDEGYSVETLKLAIDGMHLTPHNLGDNERGQKYLSLELCMRNGSQVQRFAETASFGPPKKPERYMTNTEKIIMGAEEYNELIEERMNNEREKQRERVRERENPRMVLNAALKDSKTLSWDEN